MQHRDALIVDYGPKFEGAAVRTGEGIVCVVPHNIRDSPQTQAGMRELVTDLGGECGHCPNCPLGHGG
jgi:hypothetical protein